MCLRLNRDAISFCLCAWLITPLLPWTFMTMMRVKVISPALIAALIFFTVSRDARVHKICRANKHTGIFVEVPSLDWSP